MPASRRFVLDLIMAVVAASLTVLLTRPASGQEPWSFVFTPQVWLSHIPENGFAAAPTVNTLAGAAVTSMVTTVESSPTAALDPQWGGQLAALRDPWSFAIAVQYVSFGTRNDINTRQAFSLPLQNSSLLFVPQGVTIVQEFVNTDRLDLDLAVSRFFRDVVEDRLDVNAGLGFKFIYASASRNFANAIVTPTGPLPITYFQCTGAAFNFSGPSMNANCRSRTRVAEDDYVYGLTVPVSFNVHLDDNRKWFALINIIPLFGMENRNDRDVVYQTTPTSTAGVDRIVRLDGAAFAVGATADAGVRYIFDNGMAIYGGFRVQFISGHQQYLAWGPMVNMSVRFGR
ncbi:MAG: hypothetical protein ACREKS_16755 [Candidatus Rokuibacteriota bacterium]